MSVKKMILLKLLSLICLLLVSATCGSVSFRNDNLGANPNPEPIPSDTLITLKRGACYGPCPIYKLMISADGTVVYEGQRYVKTAGVAKSRIDQEKLRRLISEFENMDYFSMDDSYGAITLITDSSQKRCPEFSTDKASATTSIRMNGKSKSVYHYYGCEGLDRLKELTALENKIDEIANSKQWVS